MESNHLFSKLERRIDWSAIEEVKIMCLSFEIPSSASLEMSCDDPFCKEWCEGEKEVDLRRGTRVSSSVQCEPSRATSSSNISSNVKALSSESSSHRRFLCSHYLDILFFFLPQ